MTSRVESRKKKVLLVQANSAPDSLCSALAEAYVAGAQASSDCRRIDLANLEFDPVLHAGYRGEQPLEPDLQRAQADILWADHLVWVYPNWWGSMPALLKGFFDRVLTPGFAFRHRPNSALWDKLLVGRTAELLVTMDTPGWYYRWIWHRPGHQQMKHTILGYCGVKTVRITEFAPVHGSSADKRRTWIRRARTLGEKAV